MALVSLGLFYTTMKSMDATEIFLPSKRTGGIFHILGLVSVSRELLE